MTNEERATWIRRIFILLLAIAVPALVFAPWKKKPMDTKPEGDAGVVEQTNADEPEVMAFDEAGSLTSAKILEILAEASAKRGGIVIGIIHCHVPGNPQSEEMAGILDRIATKYGTQVRVMRVNIVNLPEIATAEKVTNPPKVVMMVGTVRACKFQGLWTQAQVERKVDELLFGLKRVDKDWRPEVKGMQPASQAARPTQSSSKP